MVHDCMDRTIMDRLACFVFVKLARFARRQRRAAGFRRTAIARYYAGHASRAWVKAEPRGPRRPLARPRKPSRTACGSERSLSLAPSASRTSAIRARRRPHAPPARETATELGRASAARGARRAAAPRRQR